MKRLFLALIFILACSISAHGQGLTYRVGPFQQTGNVYICPVHDGGTPCPSPVTVYTNVGLTTTIPQPLLVLAGSALTIYLPAGQYTVQFPTIAYNQIISLGGTGGGGGSPAGTNGAVQINNNGSFGAGGCIDLSGVFNCTDSLVANTFSANNATIQSGGTSNYTYTSGAAVVASELVKLDATGRIIQTTTSDTSGILGMASGAAGSAGSSVLVVLSGPVPALKADGACTIGQSLINSATVAGDVRCTSSPTGQVVGISQQTIGSAATIKATLYPQVAVTSSSSSPAGATGAIQSNAGGGAFGAIGCLDASSTLNCTDAVVFSGGMSSNNWCPIGFLSFCATLDSAGDIAAAGNLKAGGSGASALFLPATSTPSTVSGNVDIHAPSSITSGSLDVTWLGAPCNGSLTSTLNDATHMTVTCGASTSNAFTNITSGTNSNGGTFTATGNAWDFTGATFKLPSATAPAYVTTGTTFTTNGGCSEITLKGGGSAGNYTSGTTGTCTVTVTMGSSVVAPPNGWMCFAINFNSPGTPMLHTGGSATTAIFSGTTTSGDQIGFWCGGY